jgi:hypothetical protein
MLGIAKAMGLSVLLVASEGLLGGLCSFLLAVGIDYPKSMAW